MSAVHVLGRFPPPLDGQAVATARLADLLDELRRVHRIDTNAPEGDHVVAPGRVELARALHYLALRRTLRRHLARAPEAPVLWPSVSPSPLGHTRDLLTVAPAFGPHQPVAAVVHRGDFARLFTSPLTSRTGRRLVRQLAAVVFLTDGLAEACARWIPAAKRVVIPNTIDDAAIPSPQAVARKRTERTGAGPLRLLYLSGMIPSKGFGVVLDATAVLRRRGVAVQTTFAGRWESVQAEAAFRSRVDALGLARAVDVRGGVSRTEASALHLAADLLMLPTQYPTEAQPLVVLEAFAAGTPVVVTRHAGLPEMVTDGTEGLFVPPADPDAIADAVERAAEPERWAALSHAARARFEAVYAPDVVSGQWEAFLDTLRTGP